VIAKAESVFDELQDMHDRIARRAYDIFTNNGRTVGRELDDWLEAENELVWEPSIELSETDKEFVLDMAIPGVDAKDIDMEVTPDYLVVKAGSRHDHQEGRPIRYATKSRLAEKRHQSCKSKSVNISVRTMSSPL
jgi:HSP20 family molecular chaperone IbpA